MDEIGHEDVGKGDMISDEEMVVSEGLGESSDLIWDLSGGLTGCQGGLVVWVEDALQDLYSDISGNSDDLKDMCFLLGVVSSKTVLVLSGDEPWDGSGLGQNESVVVDERKIWEGGVQGGLLLSPSLRAFRGVFGVLGSRDLSGESGELSKTFDSPVSNCEWHVANFYFKEYRSLFRFGSLKGRTIKRF